MYAPLSCERAGHVYNSARTARKPVLSLRNSAVLFSALLSLLSLSDSLLLWSAWTRHARGPSSLSCRRRALLASAWLAVLQLPACRRGACRGARARGEEWSGMWWRGQTCMRASHWRGRGGCWIVGGRGCCVGDCLVRVLLVLLGIGVGVGGGWVWGERVFRKGCAPRRCDASWGGVGGR